MLAVKIWVGAQIFNAIISIFFFKELTIFIVPFALVCGAPAGVMYYMWITTLRERHLNNRKITGYSMVVFSFSTMLCVAGMLILMETASVMHHSLLEEIAFSCAIPVTATLLSTLLFKKDLLQKATS